MQQHRGLAHSEGRPFLAWQQSAGTGFHYAIADEVWAIQNFALKPLTSTDGWEITGAEVIGIDPVAGLKLKATDEKDYVCALFGGERGINALAYDDAHKDPKTKQRAKFPAVALTSPGGLGEWLTVVLEIHGHKIVATIDVGSVTVQSPLAGEAKHSITVGADTEASFRRLRMWEAVANPGWQVTRATLLRKQKVPPKS
ncbi:MAG: hypothetical protein K1X78_02460 [Verrucomicrobiaceae bacterium]|nr:hypothetical protein [Verrucomicrobiaceae bacterium]